MSERRIGIAMNGVTGRTGRDQHLVDIGKNRGWVETQGFDGFCEVEIFSRRWWAEPMGGRSPPASTVIGRLGDIATRHTAPAGSAGEVRRVRGCLLGNR